MKKRTNQGRVETRDELVEEGDFATLFLSMLELNPNFAMHAREFEALARAIGRKAVIDPAGMTIEALTLAMGLTTYLLCRSHYVVASRIKASDQARRTKPGELPADVSGEWLPRLERIVQLLNELARTQATMTYLHGQASTGGSSHERRSAGTTLAGIPSPTGGAPESTHAERYRQTEVAA